MRVKFNETSVFIPLRVESLGILDIFRDNRIHTPTNTHTHTHSIKVIITMNKSNKAQNTKMKRKATKRRMSVAESRKLNEFIEIRRKQ